MANSLSMFEEVQAIADLIQTLQPRPGSFNYEPLTYITPDVFIDVIGEDQLAHFS
ncbi:hypothetical protein KHA80_13645 [Anaerobacillus sp. HL2]|nr:hypothetical protein KHA80_13645 [Anaerobacillus sp. HL2]